MMENSFFWVIGGGEMQLPVIHEAKSLGYKVICSDLNPNCIAASHADLFYAIDIFDIPRHLQMAAKLSESCSIEGVLAAGIDAPETMAQMAKYLSLPGVCPEIATLVHNKAKFRVKLEELGFPVPRYKSFDASEINEVDRIASDIGYPLVVKNTDSSGSRGTRIFYRPNANDLRTAALEAIRVSRSGMAIMESFWDGPEQTIETIYDVNGKFHPCFITDRIFDKSTGFAVETGLRHPSSLPVSTQDEMYAMAKEVADAIGIRIGAAKYDCILTSNGPRIIEMTVRLSGGFDSQYLVPCATGKNIIRAAVLTALGKEFPEDLLISKRHRVASSTSIWPAPGVIKRIDGLEQARLIPGVERIVMRKNVGDVVEPYSDCTKRCCFIIASAESQESLDDILISVEKTLRFVVE